MKLRKADSFISNDTESTLFPTKKTILLTEYELGKNKPTLLIANVHALNFPPGSSGFENQLTKLKTIIEKHKGPVIVSGDFNTWSDEKLTYLKDIVTMLGLSEVEYANKDAIKTAPWYCRSLMFFIFDRTPLDHIFYSQKFLKLNRKGRVLTEIKVSDHYPLSVEFKLKNI